MKKFSSFFLIGIFGLIIFLGTAFSVQAATEGDYTYTVVSLTSKITGYIGSGGAIVIPATLGGYPVTNIDTLAFATYTNITSVVIPNSVTSIGSSAFDGCIGLTSVIIGTGVTSIGGNAFRDCYKLVSVTIPSNVTSIGTYAFAGDISLIEILVDGSSVSFASENGVLFNKTKTSLVSYPSGKIGVYTIPSSVTSIVTSAFNGCIGLTSVTIPSSVTTIGTALFSRCKGLMEIIVDPSNLSFSSEDGVLFNKTKTTLVAYPGGRLGSYVVPSSVTTINTLAFSGCETLTGIVIPNSVITINANAFFECTALSSVVIGSGLATLGVSIFSECTSLLEITVDINNTAYASENGVLFNKTKTILISFPGGKLDTSYVIPSSVLTLSLHAFNNSKLTSMVIPNNVTTVSNHAFSKNTEMVNINIGSGVTSFGTGVFFDCHKLMEITVDPSNASYSSEDGVLFNKTKTSLISYPPGKIGSYIVPDSVTSIGVNAFRNCLGLTSITTPVGLSSIGNTAFLGSVNLTDVFFLGNAPTIGTLVFGIYNSTFNVNYISDKTGFTDVWYLYQTNSVVDLDSILLASDKTALVFSSIKGSNVDLSNITVALTNPLPSLGANGSVITWVSSSSSVVSNDGQTITRPAYGGSNATLTMTATLTKGVITDTKAFSLIVLADTTAPTPPVVTLPRAGGMPLYVLQNISNQKREEIKTTIVSQNINNGYIFNKNLNFRMTNSDVLELQKYLNNNGFIVAKTGPGSKGNETTKFGLATRSALIKFQKSNNIPATGYFGPLTRKVVNPK